MKTEDIDFLSQLVKSLEEATKSLRQNYENKNPNKFTQSKKIMLKIQEEISEIIR